MLDYAEKLARRQYENALRSGFWRNLRSLMMHRCNDLLPTGRLLRHLDLHKRRSLGVRIVALDKIVGSTRRYREFDLAYAPRRREEDDRWVNIARARYLGIKLPPVDLFKIGDAYFVEDGNHRVSVARARGEKFIEASVIEIDPAKLTPEPACTRLRNRLPDGKER